jgi:ATP-dependent protease ClpP protease subunit
MTAAHTDPTADPDLTPQRLALPDIRLFGGVDDNLFRNAVAQFDGLLNLDGPILFELTTLGGAADTGRRLAQEVGARREALGRRIVFIGKTTVYSAGVTVMSGFPRADRYLTRDCRLLIHQRQMDESMDLRGPLAGVKLVLLGKLAEVETGVTLQDEGFRALIEGSDISFDEIRDMAERTTYLSAEEALERGLIAGIV